jgi:beta-galactosidase
MGVNAYRTSHNQPTEELLDACDQLGMLVLDENRRIGTNAEPMSQLNRLIRRDRNHPSIFMWSLGNEESLQGDTANGAPVVQAMQNAVHPMDPTRLCTIAMNGGWGSGFSTVIDVQGFNYHMENMDSFHASFPNQPSLGTEISSAVGDRDVYATDWGNAYLDSYDDSTSGQPAGQWWPFYHARPWASGGFSWTGFDYRGEPYPFAWPSIGSHFGTLDTCGFAKDNFYYY